MNPTLMFDFETRSTADLKRAGAQIYSAHPTTDALCLAFAFVRSRETDVPVHLWRMGEEPSEDLRRFFTFMADGAEVVGHNVTFDLLIWNNVCVKKYGWPPLNYKNVRCTMAQAYAMGLPGSLEKAAAAVGIEAQKDMKGHRVMMQLSQPRALNPDGSPVWWTPEDAPEKFEQLYSYCVQDLKVEMELDARLLPLSSKEKAVWELDYRINQRGIKVDVPSVRVALALVEEEKSRLNAEMKRVTGGAVSTVTATGQLTDWIGWQGVELEGVAKADVVELLSRADLPPQVREALLLRQEGNKSSTAKLSSMLEAASPDDHRVRGMYQYHGAGTGRWAGRRLQLQNFPRRSLLGDYDIRVVFDWMGEA